ERADIDAELEGVRRNDATDGAVPEALLDGAPLRWEISAAIPADEVLRPPRLREARAKVRQQQLGLHARAGERDGLHARGEKRRRDITSGEERALADAERLVHDGWVHEGKYLLASGRAVAIDDHDVILDMPARELFGIGDRCRRADERRMGSVKGAHPSQAAQHVRDVRSENAAIRVQLVEHNETQVLE